MATLYEITGAYLALQDAADDGADIADALASLTDTLNVKAERIGCLLRNQDAEVDALDAEIVRLTARKKARLAAREQLKAYVLRNMEAAGITRIQAPAFTFSVRASESVEVVDFDAVPAEYKRTKTETTVAKNDVLAAWRQNGEVVPGANVVTKNTLVVK